MTAGDGIHRLDYAECSGSSNLAQTELNTT